MKKLLLSTLVAASLTTLAPVAQAATATGTFDVNITLTPFCEINTTPGPATITNMAMAYTSFQATAATATTNFSLRCTAGLSVTTIAVDSASVLDGATGLNYTLAVSASAVHSVGPTVSIAAVTPGAAGTTYYVHGNIAAGQAGAAPGAANNTRTITVTY